MGRDAYSKSIQDCSNKSIKYSRSQETNGTITIHSRWVTHLAELDIVHDFCYSRTRIGRIRRIFGRIFRLHSLKIFIPSPSFRSNNFLNRLEMPVGSELRMCYCILYDFSVAENVTRRWRHNASGPWSWWIRMRRVWCSFTCRSSGSTDLTRLPSRDPWPITTSCANTEVGKIQQTAFNCMAYTVKRPYNRPSK